MNFTFAEMLITFVNKVFFLNTFITAGIFIVLRKIDDFVEQKIRIEDYSYELPEDRIAKYPLERRDSSRLLIFKDRSIRESKFSNLAEFIPEGSLMVFNNTKVVPARLFFRKPSGASIEVFCLEPFRPSDYNVSFAQTEECEWKCVVGNAKKWKEGEIFLDNHTGDNELAETDLRAFMVSRGDGDYVVRFTWSGGKTFSEVLSLCGNLPIPPYLHRDTEALDLERYQTTYARFNGSVAAPTAGLHFTPEVISDLRNAGVKTADVCLHVGAGTFLPVKSEYVSDHRMHSEVFSVSRDLVKAVRDQLAAGGKIVAVGTTSTRTLESLYYAGARIMSDGYPVPTEQWDPYGNAPDVEPLESISAIYDYMCRNSMDVLTSRTRIIIVPGYVPKIVDVLVTNFHQPQSTLLLLISAFVGDSWKDIYRYALDNGFRFLSYGDSSVLFRQDRQ